MTPIGNTSLGSKEGCGWWVDGVKRRNGGGERRKKGVLGCNCTTFPAGSLEHKVQNLERHR